MTIAYLGIGSNIGDKRAYIQAAIEKISLAAGIKLLRVASLYETAPWGKEDQDWFLNTVAEIDTDLTPQMLLQELFKIEQELGRIRNIRWGPRTIDLDLLLYGEETIDSAELQVPHPRMAERAFVLVPLWELCPDKILPQGSLKDLAARYFPGSDIRKLTTIIDHHKPL